MPAKKWGTANAESINLARVLAGRRAHRTAPGWSGRIDEAAHGGYGDPIGNRQIHPAGNPKNYPVPEPKTVWSGDDDRHLQLDFASRDFH